MSGRSSILEASRLQREAIRASREASNSVKQAEDTLAAAQLAQSQAAKEVCGCCVCGFTFAVNEFSCVLLLQSQIFFVLSSFPIGPRI